MTYLDSRKVGAKFSVKATTSPHSLNGAASAASSKRVKTRPASDTPRADWAIAISATSANKRMNVLIQMNDELCNQDQNQKIKRPLCPRTLDWAIAISATSARRRSDTWSLTTAVSQDILRSEHQKENECRCVTCQRTAWVGDVAHLGAVGWEAPHPWSTPSTAEMRPGPPSVHKAKWHA